MKRPTRRVNHADGHIYFLDGSKTDGVTGILKAGVPMNLEDWAARETAGYAIDFWEELAELKPSERYETLKRARFETRDSAAVRGTEIHKLVWRLARGERPEVRAELEPYVDAYLRFADEDWEVEELLVEAVVGHRAARYMGTLDVIAKLADGRRWILDFKTGRAIYPESALQLAAYRYAEWYIGPDGDELELPAVDAAGVVHLRDDGYSLFEVAADEDAFKLFRHARKVAYFSGAERADYIGEPLTPPSSRRLEAVS